MLNISILLRPDGTYLARWDEAGRERRAYAVSLPEAIKIYNGISSAETRKSAT